MYWGTGVMLESDGSGNLQREFILANGMRIARRDISTGAVHYFIDDHLGSTSVLVSSTGTVENRSEFAPYGGEWVYQASASNQNYKFTGKERDSESQLDNFGARYYGSSLGRFMTPDWAEKPTAVPYAVFGDPQTLNLYAYVENAPMNKADADGHAPPGYSFGPDCNDGNAGDCRQKNAQLEMQEEAERLQNYEVNQYLARNDPPATQQSAAGQSMLTVTVFRSSNLSDIGQKSVDAQLHTLTNDMTKLGLSVQVGSDATGNVKDAQFQKGALNIVIGTSTDFGRATSGSGWVTSRGQTFAGMRINEYMNLGDKEVMSHEVLHFLNGDNRHGVNGRSWWRELRVDWQVFKLSHGWTGGMQNLKNNLGELQP